MAMTYNSYLINDVSKNIAFANKNVQCAETVIKNNFACGVIITLVASDNSSNSLLETLNRRPCYNVITSSAYTKKQFTSTDVYLVLINDTGELASTLFKLSRDGAWNPALKFLIVIQHVSYNDIHETFAKLLQYRIFDVIILANLNMAEIELLTYAPFDKNNCGKNFDNVISLGFCTKISKNINFFQRNFSYKNCSIVAGLYEVVPYIISNETEDFSGEFGFGIEKLILDSIASLEQIEIQYKYFKIERGAVLSNGSADGLMGYLQSDKISLVAGGFLLTENRAQLFDYIWGYNYAGVTLVTPAIKEIAWKKVYREFGIKTWLLIACSICVMFLVTFAILKYYLKKHQDALDVVLRLMHYLLDHNDTNLFSNEKLKLILIFWIWYTYFINSFYKTAYYSLITGHVKEKPNFEPGNLTSVPYESCLSKSGRNFLESFYNVKLPPVKRILECGPTEGSLDYIVEERDRYTILTEFGYNLNAPKYIDADGNFELEGWNVLSSTISAFYCSRGFALREKFHTHALHVFDSGVLQYPLTMMKVKRHNFANSHNKYFKRLLLTDFRIPFCILLVGLIVSFLCFVYEKFN